MLEQLKNRARQLRRETYALYLAGRHPLTPWHARLLVAAIVAYAVSPIDLIPDFLPVLGYLDDLILIPLGLMVAIKLIPPPVLAECRARAAQADADGRLVSRTAAVVIVSIWLVLATVGVLWIYHALR